MVEAFVPQGDGVRRVLLIGTGSGSESDYERAGGALTARLLTSGVQAVAVDFAGTSARPPKAAARFAGGAAQRGWRHDVYRTKLPEKSKPTLDVDHPAQRAGGQRGGLGAAKGAAPKGWN